MHAHFGRVLMQEGQVTATNGFTRRFYGRKVEWKGRTATPAQETLRKLVAHLPQVYTTYSTTLGLLRLWVDPENRRSNGSLVIYPMLTVHDSLITGSPTEVRAWAAAKRKAYFNNPITIATSTLVIPASGTGGPNWLHQGAKKWGACGGFDL
jgi:hypothetical protein